MQIRILGSGNAFHHEGRGHSSVYVRQTDGNGKSSSMLIDAGATVLYQSRKQKIDLRDIDGICITHFHGDHLAGLPFLILDLESFGYFREELVIAGPSGIKGIVESWLNVAYPGHTFTLPIRFLEAKREFNIGDFRVSSYPTTHSDESTGYRIEGESGVLAVSGDSEFDENLSNLCRGSDVAIIEATLSRRAAGSGHTSVEELVAGLPDISATRIVCTHLGEGVANLIPKDRMIAAHDGMEIVIDK